MYIPNNQSFFKILGFNKNLNAYEIFKMTFQAETLSLIFVDFIRTFFSIVR